MHRIIVNDRRRAYEWVHANYPENAPPEPYHPALILEKSGDIQAVVVYTNYDPVNSNVELHVASVPGGRWMTRAFLAKAFEYPFIELDCRRITCRISARNIRARRFTQNFGWTLEGIIRKAWLGEDLLIYGMLREECRFLGSAYHRKTEPSGSAQPATDGCGTGAGQLTNGASERRI